MKSHTVLACTIVTLYMFAVPDSQAKEQGSLDYTLGYDYSEGKYGGSDRTIIHYVPFSVTYKHFPWKLKVTVPYIRISGPGNVISGADGGVVIDTATDEQISEHGLGDSVLSASYSLDGLWQTSPFIDLTAKIKLPTADEEKRLGTGEIDYSFKLDIAKSYGNTTPFGTLGYKIVGDPEDLKYDNSLFASLGVNYKLSDRYSAGLLFDYRQAILRRVEDPQEGIAYLNWKFADHLSLMSYLVAGFSDGSPDTGLGLQIKYIP